MEQITPTIKMGDTVVVAAIKMGVSLKAISTHHPLGALSMNGERELKWGFHDSWPLFHWKVQLNIVLFEYLAYQF